MSHLPADAHRRIEPATCCCFPGTCRGGEVVDGRLYNGARCRVVSLPAAPRFTALVQFIDGLLAQLGREPTEAELRAAAHALTVRADRIACAAANAAHDGDGA